MLVVNLVFSEPMPEGMPNPTERLVPKDEEIEVILSNIKEAEESKEFLNESPDTKKRAAAYEQEEQLDNIIFGSADIWIGLEEHVDMLDIVDTLKNGRIIDPDVIGSKREESSSEKEEEKDVSKLEDSEEEEDDDFDELEEGGINTTVAATFELGDKKIVGFMKKKSGEAYFNSAGEQLEWSEETGEYIPSAEQQLDMKTKLLFTIWGSDEFRDAFSEAMAEKYDIPFDERKNYKESLFADYMGARIDIPIHGYIERELVMSRIDMLTKFDVIPPTVIRKFDPTIMKDTNLGTRIDSEIASVQQGVESARFLYSEEFDVLHDIHESAWAEQLGIEDPEVMNNLKQSLTRLAAIDWLMGATDRHFENLMYNPLTGKFTGIDNGLHSARGRGVAVKHLLPEGVNMPGAGKDEQFDVHQKKADHIPAMRALRSIPLEIVDRQESLVLSDQDRRQLDDLYQAIKRGGPEKKAVGKMFQMMFLDEREANVEMDGFMERLKYLAEHGRPNMEGENFYNIGYITRSQEKEEERKALEETQAA